MCGITGIISCGAPVQKRVLREMTQSLTHRGPDDEGFYINGTIGMGSRRLSILDLSHAGRQPMASPDGRYWIVFNGEVYNYIEIREELGKDTFISATDTEVALRAFERWGARCLDRLNGMFAFAIWDTIDQSLFATRDRFGVKPFYYVAGTEGIAFASEIKALFAWGLRREPDLNAWRDYLVYGLYEHSERTFFRNVKQLPPGHYLIWREGQQSIRCYYDLAKRVDEWGGTAQSEDEVMARYRELLVDAIRLRFRSDVPVGICLSGGLDSSALLATVHTVQGADSSVKTFTYTCGDPKYDESPWVKAMLEGTNHPAHFVRLTPEEVPELAERVQYFQEGPFGGIPTLALSKLFELAKKEGVTVLLDGQGLDEQWAGYDYYAKALINSDPLGQPGASSDPSDEVVLGPVQASSSPTVRPECLTAEFRRDTEPVSFPQPFRRALVNLRYRDIRFTKLPRALRFGDRVSMMHSCELREPCLDYRLVELALAQPDDRLIRNSEHKTLLRRILGPVLPASIVLAPKRPVQSPQREWLAGPLREWVEDLIGSQAFLTSGWFDPRAVRKCWEDYLRNKPDNSFFVWQWVSTALVLG